ncbi:hypothetical protein Goshw_029401 [Gossypium schwendimanii]|uniref:Uncharacterized protein n=1 Tax=Gossypium schwendimanii TaxID=34291 RepID=A0A7J9L057_GOSSC|nr:hypothetical protein [Gossypium schwendimanii]
MVKVLQEVSCEIGRVSGSLVIINVWVSAQFFMLNYGGFWMV